MSVVYSVVVPVGLLGCIPCLPKGESVLGLLGKISLASLYLLNLLFFCFHLDLLDSYLNLWGNQWVRSAAGPRGKLDQGDSDLVGASNLSAAHGARVVSEGGRQEVLARLACIAHRSDPSSPSTPSFHCSPPPPQVLASATQGHSSS